MPRPIKRRFIGPSPSCTYFKPRGVPCCSLEVLRLCDDEFEALRLADLIGDDQEAAAAKMNISRQTFGRILQRARRTVAEALAGGKALAIGGGAITRARRRHVRCGRCRRTWDVPSAAIPAFACPRCRRS